MVLLALVLIGGYFLKLIEDNGSNARASMNPLLQIQTPMRLRERLVLTLLEQELCKPTLARSKRGEQNNRSR